MASMKRTLGQMFLSLAIAVFLLISMGLPHFGMTMPMDMDEHGNMTMTDCYMPGMATICNMTPLEHISSWQSMFTSVPTQNFMLSLLLLVFGAVATFVWITQTHSPPDDRQRSLFSRRREHVPLHSQLQELFSQGILNPKLF